jgi:hypothetical protein
VTSVSKAAKTGTHWRRIFALTVFAGLMLAALALANSGRAAIETPPPPSVWSDKADYAPGEQVTLSGANWAPGESVHIRVNDDVGETWRRDVDVTADANGAISDQFNLPDWFVATYSVTATGASSGTATWNFTDSNPQTIAVTPSSVSVAQGSAAVYTVTLTVGGNTDQCNVTLAASGLPTGATATFATNPLVTTGSGGSPQTTSLTINTAAATPTGSSTITVSGAKTGAGCQGSGPTPDSATLVVTSGDTTAPTVSSINRLDASPTNTVGNVRWTVTFSESVTGVDSTDFTLANTGLGGTPGISTVSGSGASYTVTGSSGTGSGTLGLNLNDNDSIQDGAANKLGGTGTGTAGGGGAGNGSFAGQDYTIDRSAPTVTASAVKGDLPSFSGATAYTAGDWTNKDVRVTFTCADTGGSSLTAGSGNQAQDFTAETGGATATFSGTCADNAGNTASGATFGLIKIDKTAPVISDLGPTPSSPNGNNGWYVTDVSNKFKASDATSGLSATCTASFPLVSGDNVQSKATSGEGLVVKVTSDSCSDQAGNSAAGKDSAAFKIDKTDPSVTVALARAADHNGWYNHAVGYSVSASSDATSGIDTCDPAATYSGPEDSAASVSRSCTDNAGNTGSDSASFQYDATAPTEVVGAPNRAADHNGWYNHAVTIQFTGSDATSGIDSCSSPSYSTPDGTGLTVNGSCTDNAGNTSVSVASSSFKYDNTKPALSPTVTPNPVAQNQPATASPGASDATSGIDIASCGAVNTSTVGDHQVTCSATDNAGNTNSASVNYHVNYSFTGFFAPVDNDPTCNLVKAGSAVPIKFSLNGYQGTNIFTSGPAATSGTCSGAAFDNIEETVTAGGSSLNYDSATDQYIYVWKTDKAWAGKAIRFSFTLSDGTPHWARFTFTK